MLQLVPVIDLLGGQVVHAVAGQRETYAPLRSRLCPSARPDEVAQALLDRFENPEIYLADLDAIAGTEPAWATYQTLLDRGARLWIDAGLTDLNHARPWIDWSQSRAGLTGVIAGLETLAGPEALADLLRTLGPERLIFSLDLRAGQPLTRAASWRGQSPLSIALAAHQLGVRRFILLDLAHVGTAQGPGTLQLCRQLRAQAPTAQIALGGGIRDPGELPALAAAGANAVLLATALHHGPHEPEAWGKAAR